MRVVRATRLVLCAWHGKLILASIYGDTESDDTEPIGDVELVEDILEDICRGHMLQWQWTHVGNHSAVVSPKDFYARHMCD